MTKGEVDALDLAAMPIFLISGFFSMEIVTNVAPWGFNPAEAFLVLGPSTEIAPADVTSFLALAIVLWTNDVELDLNGGIQVWVILVTILLVLATPFVPIVAHYTSSSVVAGMVALAFQSLGYTAASVLG